MAAKIQPSFSPRRRWLIGLDVVVRAALVLAVVVMLNYIGAQFSRRFYLSRQTNVGLSSRTLAVLNSLTNKLTVTLYYDTQDQDNFYPTLLALANEYHAADKNISIRTVDYKLEPGEAEKVKEQFNLPGAPTSPDAPPNKDLIIFACGDRHDVVPGEAIVRYKLEQTAPDDPRQKELQFRKKPIEFNGEIMFTSKLLALAHAQPFKACFLQRDGEPSLTDADDNGYLKFGLTLAQNDILVSNLELLGDNDVPLDCNLLIIAAPSQPLGESELQKIDKYLAQGGRLFVLFNNLSIKQPTGLEPILQKWGVNVLPTYVKDPQSSRGSEQVVIVTTFNPKTFVNPLAQLALEMVLPRPISKVDSPNPPANAPQVDALVLSSEASTLDGDSVSAPRSYPLIVSVDQKPVAGVAAPLGSTRIVVAGDSLFLDNQLIGAAANRDFLNYAVNWLLDRQELLAGISPLPVTEYRLLLTQKQSEQLDWLLLGALPGAILLLGGIVWLVRRK
jgi:ABC-type uncharacterized transport system involved in gliding motility auxiliary subunit